MRPASSWTPSRSGSRSWLPKTAPGRSAGAALRCLPVLPPLPVLPASDTYVQNNRVSPKMRANLRRTRLFWTFLCPRKPNPRRPKPGANLVAEAPSRREARPSPRPWIGPATRARARARRRRPRGRHRGSCGLARRYRRRSRFRGLSVPGCAWWIALPVRSRGSPL